MIQIKQTRVFRKWISGLKDKRAKAKILIRLTRAQNGNLGDVKSVGSGLMEMRISEGKGYRAYFIQIEDQLILFLCGGDKSSQKKDIEKAKKMADEIRK